MSGGAGASQLTVTTSAAIAAGTYPLTISGSSGSSSHTIGVSLVVMPPPDFGLAAAPSSATVTAGGSAGYAVTVSALNGFTGDVSLSVSGLPAGASASFSPATVSGGAGASQLTVTTSAAIAAGTYPLTISGSSGSSSHTIGVSLVVMPPPDFGLAAAPSSATVTAGGSAAYAVTVSALNGFTGDVSLSVTGLPAGSVCELQPRDGERRRGASQLTVTTSAAIAAGTYPLTISGSSAVVTHVSQVTLVVSSAPDFTLAATPGAVSVKRNGQADGDRCRRLGGRVLERRDAVGLRVADVGYRVILEESRRSRRAVDPDVEGDEVRLDRDVHDHDQGNRGWEDAHEDRVRDRDVARRSHAREWA